MRTCLIILFFYVVGALDLFDADGMLYKTKRGYCGRCTYTGTCILCIFPYLL